MVHGTVFLQRRRGYDSGLALGLEAPEPGDASGSGPDFGRNMVEKTTERDGSAPDEATQRLRVLIANEKRERLERIAQFVAGLGHDVIAREIYVKEVAAVTAREQPDVALVGLGSSSDHALELISEIVREAACPVIALLERRDPAYVNEAATRGVFAYIVADAEPEELQSAIDITLRRFAEYQNLQGAFGRRARIEQAKGILMARHAIDEDEAFERLRKHSQQNGRKLIDVAGAVVESHQLLVPRSQEPAES
jgi:AmiR/NasT family two-component response regulator